MGLTPEIKETLGNTTFIVFTGPCTFNGQKFIRADVTEAAVKAGFIVRAAVESWDTVLVASTDSTKKAKDAAKMGAAVIDYQTFGEYLQELGIPILVSGQPPNPYTDVAPEDLIPDFIYDYGGLL